MRHIYGRFSLIIVRSRCLLNKTKTYYFQKATLHVCNLLYRITDVSFSRQTQVREAYKFIVRHVSKFHDTKKPSRCLRIPLLLFHLIFNRQQTTRAITDVNLYIMMSLLRVSIAPIPSFSSPPQLHCTSIRPYGRHRTWLPTVSSTMQRNDTEDRVPHPL